MNPQRNNVTDVAKAGQIDRLLVRLKSGQTLDEALTIEKCREWFYTTLTDVERAPIIALHKEQKQRAMQAASLKNSAMVWVTMTPDQKSQFQRLCEGAQTTISQRINTLIVGDLNTHMDKQPTP